MWQLVAENGHRCAQPAGQTLAEGGSCRHTDTPSGRAHRRLPGPLPWRRWLTDGEAVAEVVQAVAHDDHPGQRGDAGLLEVLLGVGVGVAVGVVVLGVVVVQDVVVVMVMVVHAVRLPHRVVEVGVAFVLAVLGRVSGAGVAPRGPAVRLLRYHGNLRRQHHLLLLRHAAGELAERTGAVRLHV